jgi:hypothetical protein
MSRLFSLKNIGIRRIQRNIINKRPARIAGLLFV